MALEKATAEVSNQQALTPTDVDTIKQTLGVDGDLAALDQVNTAEITNNAVTNIKLANMNDNTFKGRLTGNGQPQDIPLADAPISTATQTALDGKLDQRTNTTVTITSGSYTLQASDVDKFLIIPANLIFTTTIIVPNGLASNLEFQGVQSGTGDVEFVAESGGTLNVNAAFQAFTEGEHAFWGIRTFGSDVARLLGTLKLSE